jgi:hypothetical protein
MKTIKTILIIIIILVLIPLISWLLWSFKPSQPLDIMVVDKTVHSFNRNEHRALFWILVHDKYVKPDNNKVYNLDKDYFGFHPIKPIKSRKYDIIRVKLTEIDNLVDEYDMVYYTDTYGVFFNEWYRGRDTDDKGTLIEGGLNNNDYLFLKKMHSDGKLIIGEYNFFAPPTDELVRIRTEDLFGLHWSGWIGKYFHNLNPDKNKNIPDWMVESYENKNNADWTFSGHGIILANQETKDVVVLEEDIHLDKNVPEIQTTEYGMNNFDLPETVYFPNWFDLTEAINNQIIAEYEIHVNEDGKSLLDRYNLPSRFPAVIESSEGSSFYYFCGDFVEYPVTMFTAKLKGINMMEGMFYNNKPTSDSKFYWTYYQPLINQILENYQTTVRN